MSQQFDYQLDDLLWFRGVSVRLFKRVHFFSIKSIAPLQISKI